MRHKGCTEETSKNNTKASKKKIHFAISTANHPFCPTWKTCRRRLAPDWLRHYDVTVVDSGRWADENLSRPSETDAHRFALYMTDGAGRIESDAVSAPSTSSLPTLPPASAPTQSTLQRLQNSGSGCRHRCYRGGLRSDSAHGGGRLLRRARRR